MVVVEVSMLGEVEGEVLEEGVVVVEEVVDMEEDQKENWTIFLYRSRILEIWYRLRRAFTWRLILCWK